MTISFTPEKAYEFSTTGSGSISAIAFSEMYGYLVDVNQSAARHLRGLFDWNGKTEWTLEVAADGRKWITRFKQSLYRNDIAFLDETLSVLGEIASRYSSKKMSGVFAFSKDVNWMHGAFEPESAGKCWWTTHKRAREGITTTEGFYALKFYSDMKSFAHNTNRGIGRCWVYMPKKTEMYIFNAYGHFSLIKIADILSTHFGLPNHQVGIESPLRYDDSIVMYINKGMFNNEGRSGGRQGVGYCIGKDHSSYNLLLPDTRIRDACCAWCKGDYVSEDATHTGRGSICPECRIHSFPCERCGGIYPDTEGCSVQGRTVCGLCYTMLDTCSVHGKVLDSTLRYWHSNKRACRICFREGTAITCTKCGRVKSGRGCLRFVTHLGRTVYLCKPCKTKVLEA